jgi:hypothetical protein
MLVDGMTAANDLGLSDAVPGRVVVHSDARLKPVRLGNQTIVFRPTTATKLYWADRPAMRMVQALHWLKPKLENPDDKRRVRKRLESILTDPAQGPQLCRDLEAGLSTLPLWMQALFRELAPMQTLHSRPPVRRKPTRRAKAVV